jgi:hypothetical protein
MTTRKTGDRKFHRSLFPLPVVGHWSFTIFILSDAAAFRCGRRRCFRKRFRLGRFRGRSWLLFRENWSFRSGRSRRWRTVFGFEERFQFAERMQRSLAL